MALYVNHVVVAELRVLPNKIWIMADDISRELAYCGEPAVQNPRLDSLAKECVRFRKAFAIAQSCTPSRDAMMPGMHQTRTDTQDQRLAGVTLPAPIRSARIEQSRLRQNVFGGTREVAERPGWMDRRHEL